jgi:hypothetical protein
VCGDGGDDGNTVAPVPSKLILVRGLAYNLYIWSRGGIRRGWGCHVDCSWKGGEGGFTVSTVSMFLLLNLFLLYFRC